MSISFKTDISRSNGSPKYKIEVETDIKNYFIEVQKTARFCIDDSIRTRNIFSNLTVGEVAYDVNSHQFKLWDGTSWKIIEEDNQLSIQIDDRGNYIGYNNSGAD